MADRKGPVGSVVLEGVGVDGIDAPYAPPSQPGRRRWLAPLVVVVGVFGLAGILFAADRFGADDSLLFVPTAFDPAQGDTFDIHFASLGEERTEENLVVPNVTPEGNFTSFLGDGEIERYDLFGMEYEDGQLVSYRDADALDNVVLAHVKNGDLTELVEAPGFPRVFQSSSGLFAFFEGEEGCEAFVFDGLDAEAIRVADGCLPAERYFYLIDFDGDRRNVSRYDIESRELTQITEDDGPGRITVSEDGAVLVMTRFQTVDEGLQAQSSDAEVDVYTADGTEAADVNLGAFEDGVTRNVMAVLNNAVLTATFDPGDPSNPLLYVPTNGSPAVEIGEATFGIVIPSPSEDAVAVPALDVLRIVDLDGFDVFEFETDGYESGVWVNSDSFLWIDESGDVHVARTDGTSSTVGGIGPVVFADVRWENGRVVILGESVEEESTQHLYTETEGLVELDGALYWSIIDGPDESIIATRFDGSLIGSRSSSSAVGVLDPATGEFEAFEETDGFIGLLARNGSTVTYLVSGLDSDDLATHVADVSDLDSIEVEVFEDVLRLSDSSTTMRSDSGFRYVER